MCEAVIHSHTGLRVSTNFQRWQFPHQVAFPKKRGFLSSRLSRCPTTRAARPVRHNAGGVFPSTCKFSFLLYFQSTGLLPGLQSSKLQPRAYQTTAHDETSRARRHEGRTAPYQGTARRLHRLARTADMRPCSLLLRVFSTLVIESLESHEFRIGNLSVTPKVTSYYSHTKTSARYVS